MKTILSALLAVSVIAGVAGSTAQAADFGSQQWWIDRSTHQN